MKRGIIYPLFVILLCSIAYADFFVGHEVIKNEISPFGTAEFEITVMNEELMTDTYTITSADVMWNVQTSPLYYYTSGMDVGRNELLTAKLLLKPIRNIKEGTYFVEINYLSKLTGKQMRDLFTVSVDPKIVDYPVTIITEILEPTKIDPRKPAPIKVRLRNENPIYVTDAKVTLTSKFINQHAFVDIEPRSEKIVQFTSSFEETVPQQMDTLKVVVTRGNETIAQTSKQIEITTYIKPYRTDVERETGFLRSVERITFTNIEGVEKEQTAMIEISGFSHIFSKTTPKGQFEKLGDKTYLFWEDVTLSPGETYSVVVTTDYRMFALIVTVVAILAILYYVFRSPVVLTKRAEKVRIKEGGISDFKVVLEIKNRSKKPLKLVRILDRLPKLSGISEEFGAETPEPKIKKHRTEGFVLEWAIPLDPGEERIFSYAIQSKLPIVGQVVLKPVVAELGPGKRRTASNSFSLYAD